MSRRRDFAEAIPPRFLGARRLPFPAPSPGFHTAMVDLARAGELPVVVAIRIVRLGGLRERHSWWNRDGQDGVQAALAAAAPVARRERARPGGKPAGVRSGGGGG